MMRWTCACVVAAAMTVGARAAEPPPALDPRPETTVEHDARMAWWRAARFGIFIHWGPYSRLEGRWDGKEVDSVGEWIMETAHIPASAYAREAKKFDPASYDPAAWAKLFADAGAKYVVITSRHHDGFCLWDSGVRIPLLWDDGRAKDHLAPLKKAVEAQGLKFGLYYSIMDWTHPDYPGRRTWNDLWDGREPNPGAFESYIEAQLRELRAAYDPAVLWFDGEWEDAWTRDQGMRVGKLVRTIAPEAVVNDRFAKGRERMKPWKQGEPDYGDFGTPEQEVPRRAPPTVDWETCLTMNDTWGYKASDKNFKTTRELIRTLVDVASKGGNLLLNVGPDGEGRIPDESVRRLIGMGEWLAVNGEAIYGTKAGPLGKLPYGRSTQREGVIYIHVFDWPQDGKLPVHGLRNEVTKVSMVGSPAAPVSFSTSSGVLSITVPPQPPDADATVLALEIKGKPIVDGPAPEVTPPGTIELRADGAALSGPRIALERKDGERDNIGFWTDAKATATWSTVDVPAAGLYDVSLMLACDEGATGNDFVVEIGDQQLRGTTKATGSWDEFERMPVGRIRLEAGKIPVAVRAAGPVRFALMNLQDVRLTPVKGTK